MIADLAKSQTFRLCLALAFTVGAWIMGAPHWLDLLTPQSIGGLFMQGAIVTAAAFGIDLGIGRGKRDGNGDAHS